MNFSIILVIILTLLTLAVLVVGIVVMVKGGKINKQYSNKLMQARVWLQAAAIAVITLILLATKN